MEQKEKESKIGEGKHLPSPSPERLIMDYSDPHPSHLAARRKLREGGAPSDGKRSDIIFFSVLGIIVLAFALMLGVGYYQSHKRPLTIEELHELNFRGKLSKDKGYVYREAYSFVRQDGFWYTALQSQTGRTLYNFAFRYSPTELEKIPVRGNLNSNFFNNATEYFITFNPTAQNLSYTVLAVNDFNQHMLNVFKKTPIAACDRNETTACVERPIITCDYTENVVVYIKDSDKAGIEFHGNCITIFGQGFDQVKGVDRALYKFYNIMD